MHHRSARASLVAIAMLAGLMLTPAPAAQAAAYAGPCQRAMYISYYSTYWISYEKYFPIANGDYQTNCYMSRGASGNHVKALQLALNRCYASTIGTPLVVDGSFGPLTESALKKVQSKLKIAVDGAYGNQTRTAMAWPVYAYPYRAGGSRTYDNRCD